MESTYTTQAHDNPKAHHECGSDGRDGYLVPRRLGFHLVLLTSSTNIHLYAKLRLGLGETKEAVGMQQAPKVVKPRMVRGEGSHACMGHQQAVPSGRRGRWILSAPPRSSRCPAQHSPPPAQGQDSEGICVCFFLTCV